MIVDTSALVAIIRSEPEAATYIEALSSAIDNGDTITISAANLFELYLVIDRDRDRALSGAADSVLEQLPLKVASVTEQIVAEAREANRRYGRGSGSRARLNFGDCFAYALAKQSGEPLLFKGDDFAQTDVVSAV